MLPNITLAMMQGVTEIFPVSSSGHLAVYGRILGREMSFEKVLLFHLGTFFAILYFYRRDVVYILTGREGRKIPCSMLISFTTTALVGSAIEAMFVNSLVQQPRYVAALWLVNGLLVALLAFLVGQVARR